MKQLYFGPEWPANRTLIKPPRLLCSWCEEPIGPLDTGLVMAHVELDGLVQSRGQHRCCFIRSMVGSVGHLMKRCSCYGGDEEDPPGMTRRQAAEAAMQLAKDGRYEG